MILTHDKLIILRAMKRLTERLLKAADDEAVIDMEMNNVPMPVKAIGDLGEAVAHATGEWDVTIRVRNPGAEWRLIKAA